MSILGMIVVDAWLVYSKCTGTNNDQKQTEFYTLLAEELIDNNYDTVGPPNNWRRAHHALNESPTNNFLENWRATSRC